MNDPWADVRREFKNVGDPFVERLLSDADALLAVVSRALIWKELGGFYPEMKFWEALAALPEHLRGDNNERSRKA